MRRLSGGNSGGASKNWLSATGRFQPLSICSTHSSFLGNMAGAPHIEAEIEFVTSEAGGRSTPAFSGYRPQFYYHGHDWDAEHEYLDAEKVFPGDTVTAHLSFLSPQEHHENVAVGMPFLVREGTRTVAYGVVTKIFAQLEFDATESE